MAAPSQPAAIRETFAVGLIAGEGVDLSGLSSLAGDKGFSLLTRDAVVDTAPNAGDEVIPQLQKEWEDAKAKEEKPELPMPHELFGCLLAAALATPAAPAEVPEDDDSPASALFRMAGGPKSVRLTLDVPKSIAEARAFAASGSLDAVLIVRKPPPAAPADGEEAPGSMSSSIDPEVQAQGERAEALYADLVALGREQKIGGHNPHADTYFDALVAPNAAPSSDELINSIALALITPVYHRIEYIAWLQDVTVVQLAPRELDLRHYDETLAKVPHSCLSVPVILSALLEQVALNEEDPAAENRNLRKTWADNKRIMGPLEDAFASLAGTPADVERAGRSVEGGGGGGLLSKADERSVRLTDPLAIGNPAVKDAIERVRQCELRQSLTVDVARLFPVAPPGDAQPAPLGDSAVLRALPHEKLTPAQARHGLLLLEIEQMLGVESSTDGQVKANGLRPMSDMSMHTMSFREELTAQALQQQIASAILLDEPEVVTRYYSREDALLVALCSLVPKSRLSLSKWKSPLWGLLGFSQWLDKRRELKAALPEAEEDAVQGAVEDAPQEVTPGAGAGEGEEGEEKPKPKRVYKMPQLPMPDKPRRLFDLDAKNAALFEEQQVMLLAEGTRITAGTAKAGAYMRWHTQSHSVSMCQQAPAGAAGEGGSGKWAVSVTYEDGACLMLRLIGDNAKSARVCASMSCADGVHVTLDAGADGDGIVWRSVPHERVQGPRGPLGWTPRTTEPKPFSFSRTATPAPEEEGGEAVQGESLPKPKAPKPLPQGAPADPKPKDAEETMVLPSAAGGAQVIRKGDGTARVLLADGSVGWYGGDSRGWEWTNAKGMRQGKLPQFPGVPQHRDKLNVAEEGDAHSGGMARWRQDGVFETWAPGGGGEQICTTRFVDGSVSASVPAKRTTSVVRELLGQVAVGPGNRECKVQLEDGTVISVDGQGVLRVNRRGDSAEVECEISSGLVRFYSAGRAAEEGAPGRGHEDLLSQQVRRAGPGSFFMDLFKGHMRTVDSCQHLYMVTDGIAQVVLAGEPVPSLSDAPSGPRDSPQDTAPVAVSIDGAERLEPLRVFVVRRNGTGYELLAEDAAKTAMVRARRAGEMVLEETQGDLGIWTMVAPDQRGLIPQAEAERRLPANLRHVSQRPTGGRGQGGVRWRQMVMGKPLHAAVMAELRSSVQKAFDEVLEGEADDQGEESDFVAQVRAAIAAERSALGGQRSCEAWVMEKLELLRKHKPVVAPELPKAVRPPIKPAPARFSGVQPPEEPSVLRPRYFDSKEGSDFLDSIPDGRKKITKEKRPWKLNTRPGEDQEEDEEDMMIEEEEGFGGLPSMQQHQYQQEMSMERRSQGQSTRGNGFQRAQETANSGVSLPRQATTNYHLRHLRPAHYDVLNRPRKKPEPDSTRFDADPEPNERNLRLEKPVSRRVHTSSVLLKTMLDHARGTDGLSLEDSVLEGGLHRTFRLRPRRVAFGQLLQGNLYRFKMVLSNCGVQAARFKVHQPDDGGNVDPCVSVIYTPGALAAGMSAVIEVECWCDETGVIDKEAAIETETEQFFIPISAVVLPPDQFKEWEDEGGQLPCNVTSVDQPPLRMVRSKAPTVATLRRQLAQKREAVAMGKDDGGSHPHKAADLQDPVPEPHVPNTETDWFVDATRHLSEIKEMTARERQRERMIQELKRRGRPVNEATLAGIEAQLRIKFNSPRSHTTRAGTAATGGGGGDKPTPRDDASKVEGEPQAEAVAE